MQAQMSGELVFITVPAPQADPDDFSSGTRTVFGVKHMRALFDYFPEEDDEYLPCKELGMSFNKGDILHVISQQDDRWWQAYRDGEDNQLAGLIPSAQFRIQLERLRRQGDAAASTPPYGAKAAAKTKVSS